MNERDMPDLPPGTTIGGVVVERFEDAGGFGSVFRARDPRTGTLFALKFIPLHLAERRASREATIALPFHHPNLVHQVGFGHWPSPSPRFLWVKMLYVQGRPLDLWAEQRNPDALTLVRKLMGVARGLAVVHDHHIVHRDVKESNILVRDSDGEPVLLDFGAAKREGQTTLTQGLLPIGTPAYRSPEAWRFFQENLGKQGARYRPGTADDLYAVGVLLYRLLTSRFPFTPTDDLTFIPAVVHHAPLPPHIDNPRVPRPLSALCLKLLEKQPEDRHPSALALYDALDELLVQVDDSWKVPLHKDIPTVKAPPPRRARALRLAAVGLTVLAGLALAGAWLAPRGRPEPPIPPVASSSPSPTLRLLFGQEVAPAWPPPDSQRAAAPLPGETTPAVVASLATRPEDNALKKPQAPGAQGHKKQKEFLSPMARLCLGAAAAAQTACVSAQVRPPSPSPQECPPGAVETMTETLDISIGSAHGVSFLPLYDPSRYAIVREGFTSVRLIGQWGPQPGIPGPRGKLPGHTLLYGQLHFGDGRVYGRFTEARTPSGDTFKVCMELRQEGKRGVEMEPDGPPDAARVFFSPSVKAVRSFE